LYIFLAVEWGRLLSHNFDVAVLTFSASEHNLGAGASTKQYVGENDGQEDDKAVGEEGRR
jgi:hypothetical protein